VQLEVERRTFTSFLEDAERHRRERVSKESRRRRGMVSAVGSMMELGCPTLRRHHHRAHREPTPSAGTLIKTSSFYYILPYYVKTFYILMKSM
jgi:hypothetical protein